MQKLTQLLLLVSILPVLAVAQTPKKIHELKSLTDSSSTVHLFYRLSFVDETGKQSRNIYHYNTKNGKDSVFIKNYSGRIFGDPYVYTNDYKFLENDPTNYLTATTYCTEECFQFASRNDGSKSIGGIWSGINKLNVEGTDSGRVYVEMYGETVIGLNGGRRFPKSNTVYPPEFPDSSKLGFSLISVSPYNDSLLFGRKYFGSRDGNPFLRSLDKGENLEFISDTLLPGYIFFDSDSNTVYIIDVLSTPGYGLYVNKYQGKSEFWELIHVFPSSIYPNISTHPTQHGKLYIWNSDSVLVSEDYGETFEVLLKPNENITGFTVEHFKEYYTTNSSLFSYENGNSVELLSSLVSNEYQTEVPTQNKLHQNYPNPFNPSTNIQFELPFPSTVSLKVYDVLGREVATLVNGNLSAGKQTIRFDASTLANGMYLYKLRVGNQGIVRKMTLIK
tara:strand:- start:1367 stop:2707 length:1341 start_codon:yes stop_codon:yes gene_type:complete